jgi:DNA-directed RNA polymerase specialized sigma24 family protein
VTAIANDVDYVSAPKNYADLFEQYYMYVVNLCAHFGIDEQNKEDVACEILLRFMERGSLEKFDPYLVFDYRGQVRPARFKSYLSRAVEMYVRGHREKNNKHSPRGPNLRRPDRCRHVRRSRRYPVGGPLRGGP